MINLLILSHQHLDRFHIRSLAYGSPAVMAFTSRWRKPNRQDLLKGGKG